MPCNPNDLNINIPSAPGRAIPGFGIPTSLGLPTNLFPNGFPEDLLAIFDKLSLLIPSGQLKPNLNVKFDKDIFDGILDLLNKLFPFLMLYKFFLPVLNLIICIIEVLCAFPRPFKMRKAIKKLFRNCLPDFLRLFPIFALIAMLLSLLYLIKQLIEYIIAYIINLIKAIKDNIIALKNGFTSGNPNAILAATRKISNLLCTFQQLFVLLSIFNVVITIIKDILSVSFKIPPCKSGNTADASECCTTDVCPAFILNGNYTRFTGTFRYISQVNISAPPPFAGMFDQIQRKSSYSFFDNQQNLEEKFSNIYDAFDVTVLPKPIFFPTAETYTSTSDIRQVPYLVDMTLTYNPKDFDRNNINKDGYTRTIIFKNCIISKTPEALTIKSDNSFENFGTGSLNLVGGQGYEQDGSILFGYDDLGNKTLNQSSIETFLFKPIVSNPVAADLTLKEYKEIEFNNVEYLFKINEDVLTEKNIVILNCDRDFDDARTIINNSLFDNIGIKLDLVSGLLNNNGSPSVPNGQTSGVIANDKSGNPLGNRFPDLGAAVNYFQVTIAALRDNFTEDNLTNFENNSKDYLNSLSVSTTNAINELLVIAFDSNNSDFIIDPNVSFTSDKIRVEAILRDSNNSNILNGIDQSTADELAKRLKAQITFGEVSSFSFDGLQSFVAFISSDSTGDGEIKVSFDNILFTDFVIPEDVDVLPSSTITSKKYSFIKVNTGDNTQVRRTDSDVGNS